MLIIVIVHCGLFSKFLQKSLSGISNKTVSLLLKNARYFDILLHKRRSLSCSDCTI